MANEAPIETSAAQAAAAAAAMLHSSPLAAATASIATTTAAKALTPTDQATSPGTAVAAAPTDGTAPTTVPDESQPTVDFKALLDAARTDETALRQFVTDNKVDINIKNADGKSLLQVLVEEMNEENKDKTKNAILYLARMGINIDGAIPQETLDNLSPDISAVLTQGRAISATVIGDSDHNRIISKDEFKAMLSTENGQKEFMAAVDRDGNGGISQEEAKAFIANTGLDHKAFATAGDNGLDNAANNMGKMIAEFQKEGKDIGNIKLDDTFKPTDYILPPSQQTPGFANKSRATSKHLNA